MTNRFVLVPEEIYKGFTTTDTGNINLDYSKRMLENVKKEKTNPSAKNAHYNQELRRYLHLKKEHDEKPVKVEITGAPNLQQTISQPSKVAKKIESSMPAAQGTPVTDLANEFMMRIGANPEKYQVTTDGRIKNEHGKTIEGSNIKKSLNWIITSEKGLKSGPRPKGTMNIENIIKKDDVLLQMLQDINPLFYSPIGTSTPKSQFRPSRWN